MAVKFHGRFLMKKVSLKNACLFSAYIVSTILFILKEFNV